MKTSILNSITETHLVLLLHYLIIFLLILGFYACSKTGAKSSQMPPPDHTSANITEVGSGSSNTTLRQDATILKNESQISQVAK